MRYHGFSPYPSSLSFRSLCLSPEAGSGEGGGEGDKGGGTAAPQTMKVTYNGQEIEVQRPAGVYTQAEIAEKYIPKAAHNDTMARLRREYEPFKSRKSADELLDDPEFKTVATTRWGLDPSKTQQEQVEIVNRRIGEIREREVKPLETKLTKAETVVANLLEKDRNSQIVQAAAAAGVDPKYLKVAVKGGKPMIVALLDGAFAYDKEHGEWFAKGVGEQQYRFSQVQGGMPYMGITEFISDWINADGKDYARDEKQRGPETKPNDGKPVAGQVGRELRLTREQMRDITFFKQMQAKAEREGLTIVPI